MDDVDEATERIQRRVDEGRARVAAKKFGPGTPGDCEVCGYWSGRLVLGACAPCRDKYGLE